MSSRCATIAKLLPLTFVFFCIPPGPGAQITRSPITETSGTTLSPPQRTVVFSGPFSPNMSLPHWSVGYLVSRELESTGPEVPNIRLYNREGSMAREAAIWIPGSIRIILSNAEVTQDGRAVATGFAEQKDSTQAFVIALTDRSGKVARVVRTNPFVPERICLSADGTAWTAGGVRTDDLKARSDAEVLRHFDFSRGLLEAYIPQSLFETKRDAAGNLGPGKEAFLGCTSQQVILYSGSSNRYVEFSISDHSVKRWKIDRSNVDLPLNGFALTASGELYSSL